MSRVARLTVLTSACAALSAGLCGGARAAELSSGERPLLVVVETGPGAGCDGAAVRGAIEAELKARVAAPAAPPVVALSAPRSDILLVAVDRGRIVVTLRGRGDRELTRSIAAPADRAERLRAVAWLAGNVARDQLATLTLPAVPAPPAAASQAEPAAEATADPLATPATVPPPEAPPPAPALPPREAPTSGAATLVRQAPALSGSAAPRWTVGVDSGLGVIFHGPFNNVAQENLYGAMAQVEAQRHLRAPFFVGGALDLGPKLDQRWGAAVLAGVERRSNDLFLSVSLGAGVEALRQTWEVYEDPITVGPQVVRQESETSVAAYGRAAIEFGLALTRTLDLMARLNGHLSMTEKNNHMAAYAGTSLGVRMRFY